MKCRYEQMEHLGGRPDRHWTWTQDRELHIVGVVGRVDPRGPTVGAQSTLADVGTVSFGPTSTYVAGGHTYTIAKGSTDEAHSLARRRQRGDTIRTRPERAVLQRLCLRPDLREALAGSAGENPEVLGVATGHHPSELGVMIAWPKADHREDQ